MRPRARSFRRRRHDRRCFWAEPRQDVEGNVPGAIFSAGDQQRLSSDAMASATDIRSSNEMHLHAEGELVMAGGSEVISADATDASASVAGFQNVKSGGHEA